MRNSLLYQQLDEVLEKSARAARLSCESALRVGAVAVYRGASKGVTATTVVCDMPDDETEELSTSVAEIAAEYGLHASVRPQSGSWSVRFTR